MAESGKSRRGLQVVTDGEGGRRIIDDAGEIQTKVPPGRGRSIEDLADEAGEQEFLIMPVIEGTKARLDGRVGGREVTTAELKFKGGPLLMAGQFPEGARVRVVMEFEITDVNFNLIRHQGHVVGKKRIHVGELVGYGQVDAGGGIKQLCEDIVEMQRRDSSENPPE